MGCCEFVGNSPMLIGYKICSCWIMGDQIILIYENGETKLWLHFTRQLYCCYSHMVMCEVCRCCRRGTTCRHDV